jgi:FkbM family methyltransferase
MKWVFRKLEAAANHQGYRITWAPPTLIAQPLAELAFDLEYIIAHLMLVRPSVFFIQIGANNGITTDPLYKFVTLHNWDGILVEPVPEIFDNLNANYGNRQNLKFLNAAVAECDGFRTLYTLKIDPSTAEADAFYNAHPSSYSSFRKEIVLGQTEWVPDVAERIMERQVKCVSLDTLLGEAGDREVDLVLMDTEGYDYTILKMIDFSRLRPSIICYEHVHMSKAQQEEAASLLVRQGYRLTRDNLDTIAYRPRRSFSWRSEGTNVL